MRPRPTPKPRTRSLADDTHRHRLLAGVPVTERRAELAGISTAILEGGEGPPMVLLHGPGESAVNWMWVIPGLVETHRVVAPDLPAHGSSEAAANGLDEERLLAWLGEMIDAACSRPPVLVGHLLGGAIAARFAVGRSDRLRHLVLVDSLGLDRFRPSLRFLFNLLCFQALSTEGTYHRFMRQCAYDLDSLRERMGERWRTFVAYNLGFARSTKAGPAGRLLREVGLPRIPPQDLARIDVPTTLIWGRDDRAVRLRVAEAASRRYGWPLHVIDEAADDPPRDQPEAFLEALRAAVTDA